MKKLVTLLFLAFVSIIPLRAQLPDGIVAPNFTATDINGNTWTLYDLLDQGKSVVLFFGTTWSYGSWEYHQSGRLNQVWNQYGPNGTDEIVPFFIEVDDNTTPEDLNGTGGNTYGDWVTGTPYPIIDDGGIVGETYALDDVPRVYAICPNRILTNAINYPTVQFSLVHNECLLPGGVNNAGMLRFVNLPNEFCDEVSFAPNVRFQSLGSAPTTSLEFQLLLNGNLAETRNWTGNLALYQTAGLVFNPVTVSSTTTVEVVVTTVNGLLDDDAINDAISADVSAGPTVSTNFLVVQIRTDNYPREIYWEVVDDQGTVFHAGGNPGIFTGQQLAGTYTQPETVYEHEVALPSDGCYEFVIYDQYNDGICCNEGLGYYRLLDENNFIHLQGGLFTSPEHRPFALSGATTIQNNAAIRGYEGFKGDFCGNLSFAPKLRVQNIGANSINSLKIKAMDGASTLQSFDWTGTLTPGQIQTISMDDLTLDATSTVDFVLVEVNQQPDSFLFQNKVEAIFYRRLPQAPSITLEILTDQWGYENYWQITNSAGNLIASGGNPLIGPNGGGLRVATENDPGAYPNYTTITEQISLPDDVNDCYTYLFVDDWGDGISSPGYMKMTDNFGNLLFNYRPIGVSATLLLDGQFGPSAAKEQHPVSALTLSPNPVSEQLSIDFLVEKSSHFRLEVFSAIGSRMASIFDGPLPAGQQSQTLDVTGWSSGVYFMKMTRKDGGQVVRRFVVAGR
ncbi:MAG: T9SS type A sorting domain-containing protein [Saprospiraceae bacterium]|nr:T9SS type A sorting domain-containing protein [Saprospiraceae bacterium]MCF8252692.1 T9SS type A sorting domain-containing protein [Saprospiraceae bacterium]MCF8282999.1 T9SS type A sorting domain-containing protein [Bacteroidales bacterium]MCF8314265.1 T9SS type A sorting domain-containing protein [Saprospiraceae bacterium]MCF8443092.1 T9SS type A sorting domain-containing protein [Saprospiraceae bacterium]